MEKHWKRFFTLDRHHAEGFTLVELIVVIAILAILGGVAVPAYSGYVAKAERAADETLLAAVNDAFAAACVTNGTDHYSITNATAKLVDGKVDAVYVTAVDDAYNQAFDVFFEGNEDLTFEVIESLVFDAALHMFVDPSSADSLTLAYGSNGTVTISGAALNALKSSAFTTEMTPSELLGKVDYVTNLAAALMADPNSSSTFEQLIKGPEYGQILAESLGVTYGTQEFMDTVSSMLDEKMNLLIESGKYPEDSDTSEGSALYNEAYNQIVANNAVINAAQNSQAVSDDILTVLGKTGSKGEIVNTINTNSGEGLAQAAMAYGLYTAYAERNGITVPDSPADVLLKIDSDQSFKDYINNVDGNGYAQTDLEGYLASMEMINTNADTNKTAVSDILVNGFANEDLVDLLESAAK